MTRYETYRSNAAEAPSMRRWIFAALALSLLLHAAFVLYAYRQRLEGFKDPSVERITPPRVFSMKRVSIPKMDEPAEKQVAKIADKVPTAAPKNIPIPTEKPEVQEVQVAPQITEISKQLLQEKPKVDPAGLDRLANMEAGSRNAIDKELTALNTALLKEGPRSAHQPILSVSPGAREGSGNGEANAAIPGMKSLDEALAQTGPLHAGEKAGMPGGALFEYNSYDLRPEAMEQLRKLGLLIERNPKASFSIEGHTDSFGGAEYNQRLSELRAESVKEWLVREMSISPDRIQTRGFGNARPLVPADRSKDEQAPNRRVEIVVKTNRK